MAVVRGGGNCWGGSDRRGRGRRVRGSLGGILTWRDKLTFKRSGV